MGTREVAAEPPTRWASADDGLDGVRERLALAMDRTGQSQAVLVARRRRFARHETHDENERDRPHEPHLRG